MARLAGKVSALVPDCRIQGVTLAMPGALEQALAACRVPPVIYPFFMSDGWFTADALPKRLNGSAGRILDPLGLDPGLAGVAAENIRHRAAARHWSPDRVTLILAAHGSGRSRNPARAARMFADALSGTLELKAIRIGFVEEDPSIAQAAQGAGPQSICLPFFAATGGHVLDDIPQDLAKAGFAGETLDPVGVAPQIPALVAQAIARSRLCDAAPGPRPPDHARPDPARDRVVRQIL